LSLILNSGEPVIEGGHWQVVSVKHNILQFIRNNMEAVEFMKSYCDFSNPHHVWIMKGISRNKDNDKNGVKFLRRFIINKKEDIELCRYEIKRMAYDTKTNYRLYMSLNSRDVVNSAFQFQKRLIDVSIGLAKGHEDALNLSKKIGSLWKTDLEQRCNRGTKRVLLDIDDCQDEIKINSIKDYIKSEYKTVIHCARKTVTGYAIVIDACDTRGLLSFCNGIRVDVDLQRDSMVFVEKWKGIC